MGGRFTPRILAAVLIGAGACAPGTRAAAGDQSAFVPAAPGAQIMVYMSRSIGVHGAAANHFGLRYERATPQLLDPAARFSAPLRHRALVDLQFTRGLAPRMQFGPRVTWDMGRGQLGPTSLAMYSWPLDMQSPLAAPLARSVP